MADFTDHQAVLSMLAEAQSADEDIRNLARESHHFIDKEDGQWDPGIISQMNERPRFTFDMVSGLIDDIAGDLESADFSIKIRPAGGGATDDIAKTYDGLIRNVQDMSNATTVYNAAARSMITCGMDGWRVTTDWVQSDAFDQDLLIAPIANYLDRVWFDPSSELQDKSDANWCVVLQAMTPDEYKETFPNGSRQSVSDNRLRQVYFNQVEFVIVGELLYKKKVRTKLSKMSNDAVYTEEQLDPVRDELQAAGITVERERTKEIDHVHSRFFDGGDWLDDAKETVFEWLPVIPVYANYKITENKTIWRGEVQKKMDAQRVYNYAKSREIEEGALAPRGKYWMTEAQAEGHEDTLETLNTNADPVQFYNPDDEVQQSPFWQGGAQVNQGLQLTAADAKADIRTGSGQVDPALGRGMFQSEGATRLLQDKADTGNTKYSKALAVGICHTAKILMNAAPKVYDSKRLIRVLNEDDSFEMVTLNEQVLDEQTGKMETLNDLSQGVYDATCDVGPAFKNRQQETIDQMLRLAEVVPGVMEIGLDVFLASSDAPKINLLQERAREKMVQGGAIPFNQLTDKEKALVQQQQQLAAQQPPEQSPEDKAAEALKLEAEVTAQKLQIEAAEAQSKIAERELKGQLEIEKLTQQAENADDKSQLAAANLQQQSDQTTLKAQQQQFDQRQAQEQAIQDQQQALNDMALKITELEAKVGQPVDAAFQAHKELLVFDPAVGDFL